MKIACIAPSRVPSTTANSMQLMKTCHALSQNGHAVRLWLPAPGNSEWEILAEQYGLSISFEIRWLKSIKFLRRYDFSFKAVSQSKKWGAEVVYTWLPQAACFALSRNIPAVLELHDLPTGKLGPWLIRTFLKQKEKKRLVLITQALATALERKLGIIIPSEVKVIAPNAVEPERFRDLPPAANARKALNFQDKPTAIYSGHFYAGRGMELMVKLAQNLPDMQFIWVGGNPLEIEFWRRKLRSQAVENVILTGFIPNAQLPIYLASGDFLLMPYENEIAGSSGGNSAEICSPMKMFEYLATGRVIIASDLPVLHEVLDEKSAVFCPPNEPEKWGEVMKGLLKDKKQCLDLAANAKEKSTQYSWQERARHIMEGFV